MSKARFIIFTYLFFYCPTSMSEHTFSESFLQSIPSQQSQSTSWIPQFKPLGSDSYFQSAPPSLGSVSFSVPSFQMLGGGIVPGFDSSFEKLGIPTDEQLSFKGIGGTAPYFGTSKFERCQLLASEKWENIISKADTNPQSLERVFLGAYNNLSLFAQSNSKVHDHVLKGMAGNLLANIRECFALGAMMSRSNFSKQSINQESVEKSYDERISCYYEGAEAQDFDHCTEIIAAYDQLNILKIQLQEGQKQDYSKASKKVLKTLKESSNIQSESFTTQNELINKLKKNVEERKQFQKEKLAELERLTKAIPDAELIYSDCLRKTSSFSNFGLNDYKRYISNLMILDFNSPTLSPPCSALVRQHKLNLIQNPHLKEVMERILKETQEEIRGYSEDSETYGNQSSQISDLTQSSSGGTLFKNEELSARNNSGSEGKLQKNKTDSKTFQKNINRDRLKLAFQNYQRLAKSNPNLIKFNSQDEFEAFLFWIEGQGISEIDPETIVEQFLSKNLEGIKENLSKPGYQKELKKVVQHFKRTTKKRAEKNGFGKPLKGSRFNQKSIFANGQIWKTPEKNLFQIISNRYRKKMSFFKD